MMCPDSLPELRGEVRGGESGDGFVERFLFTYPDPIDAVGESWSVVPEHLREGYEEVFVELLKLGMLSDDSRANAVHADTKPVPFDESAKIVWEEFTHKIAAKMNSLEKSDSFRAVLAKLKGYAARFAVMLWSVRRICGEVPESEFIDGETLRRACILADYFEAHASRCLGIGFADRKSRVAKRLLEWLAREPLRSHFRRSDAFQQLKDRRSVRQADSLDDVFKVLVDHGYIRQTELTGYNRAGPVPEVYQVNPLWDRCP